MNKKLLALAIGAAVAMPVSAVAAPTLYGQINVSLESVEDEIGIDSDLAAPIAPATTAEGWVVRNNSSRLGVKGEAETGVDGLKGVYQAEYGIKADDGAGPFTQRNIYAGLDGNFGKVLIGRMDTPTKTMQGKVDQFNDTAVDMSNHVEGELRASNNVTYVSPKIGEVVTVSVALLQGEGFAGADGQAADGIGDAVSASVVYDNEGLYLGLGMDKETPVGSNSLLGNLGGDTHNDIVRLAAGYMADTFEAGFLYQTAESANTGSSNESTSMILSGAMISGDWKFKAQYGMTETDDGLVGADPELTMLGLGADYALGKATTASAFYAVEEVDAGATAERTILSFGLWQKF